MTGVGGGGDARGGSGKTPSMSVRCYRCGCRFRTSSKTHIPCRECNANLSPQRARLLAVASNKKVRAVAGGPKTGDEVEAAIGAGFSVSKVRHLVRRLKPPVHGTGDGKTRAKRVENDTVYYLDGDERAAMRRFIDANHEFVADCLADKNNPLRNWSDWEYNLLLEQWYFGGHMADAEKFGIAGVGDGD